MGQLRRTAHMVEREMLLYMFVPQEIRKRTCVHCINGKKDKLYIFVVVPNQKFVDARDANLSLVIISKLN